MSYVSSGGGRDARDLADDRGRLARPPLACACASRSAAPRPRSPSISSGGSEGREGPIIQIGAALASSLSRRLKLSPERVRILTACGMAAGVAGAYNTPIAATLFVLEVVVGLVLDDALRPGRRLGRDSRRSSCGSSSATSPSTASRRSGSSRSAEFVPVRGDRPARRARPRRCSCAGLRRAKKLFAASQLPPPLAMALGGAIVGVARDLSAGGLGQRLRGDQPHPARQPDAALSSRCSSLGKIVATAATIGSGGVGGVFTPTLLVGAALGGVVAQICHVAFPDLEAPVGGYALLGMGGLLAGVTRAPLLAVIMIFELTQNTPGAPADDGGLGRWRSSRRGSSSRTRSTSQSLRSAGIVWEKTPEATAISTLKVSDIMRTDVKLAPADDCPSREIVRTFLETRSLYLYVGDEDGPAARRGRSPRRQGALRGAGPCRTSSSPRTSSRRSRSSTPHEPLTSVNEKLWFRDLGQLPVVDSPDEAQVPRHRHAARPARSVRPGGPPAQPPDGACEVRFGRATSPARWTTSSCRRSIACAELPLPAALAGRDDGGGGPAQPLPACRFSPSSGGRGRGSSGASCRARRTGSSAATS